MRLRLEKLIIGFTRGMTLRSKILVLFSLILLLPTLVLGGGAICLVARGFHHSYLASVDETVRQTAQNVDFAKQSYDLLAVRTATDGELIARLEREYTDMADVVDTVNYVDRTFLITSKYLPGISDFRIYHTNETLVQDGQLLWRPEKRMISGMEESSWYDAAMKSSSSLQWSNARDNPKQIIITRKIIDVSGDVLGMVYILLNYNAVFGELLNRPFGGDGSLYIVDKTGRILAATDGTAIGSRLSTKERPASGESGREGAVVDLTGSKDMIVTKPLSSGWTVVASVRTKYLVDQNLKVLLIMSGITAFFLLLSIFLMLTIVKNIVRRIRKLGARMSDLSRGEFEVNVRNTEKDELGELERMFNSMSERLGKLVEGITRAGLQEKEQAFKALQAQVNPHFVYNSLSLIRWRALDAQDDEQIVIIDALTTFYRLALNNRISVIPIREELEHVKAYLDIQQLRYPGRVTVEWEIDESLLDFYTIKTVLQPVVENCYLHGAITKRKNARIRIAIAAEDGNIRMSVLDNGRGIPGEVLRAIEAGTYEGKGNGFGTSNIKERLALYFGERAQFGMESEAGEWTLVTIRFPICPEEPVIRREA